jgi:ubiquinone/menaquinone biosynthesis C-methylase UbiE
MSSSTSEIWTSKVYDRLSKYYDRLSRWFFPMADKVRKRAVEGLTAGSILDVGCGTGTLLAMAHENGLQCYGIDTSQGMLNQARAKVPEAELKGASFYDIPYAEGTFDYVVETNAVSGADIDARKVLSEMLRVCKGGGEVRLVDWSTPPRETWQNRLIRKLGVLSGDVPKDYPGIFRELGYEPESEILGHHGLYQLIRVKKEH